MPSITNILVQLAVYLIKRYSDQRIKDLVFIEKIIKETREIFRKDNIGKNELEDYHYQFKYYDTRLNNFISLKCSEEDKLKIKHAILAARVLCWALKIETRTNSEIISIMNERKKMIISKDAYHSSYEIFMQKLVESGWDQTNDTKINEDNISKVKEWCRANMDELQDLAFKIKGQIKYADLLLEAKNHLGF